MVFSSLYGAYRKVKKGSQMINLLSLSWDNIWLIVGVVIALVVIIYLVRGFLYMGVYGMFVYPYFKIKNRLYGNVRKKGQVRIGSATHTLNKVMKENKKDFGGLFFELKNNGKELSKLNAFKYDFLKESYIYDQSISKKDQIAYSFLNKGRSPEAILSDSFDELRSEEITTGKKPTKLAKKMIVDSAFNTIDGYQNNHVYSDNVLFYVLGDTLFVVSRSLIPHYIYKSNDEKFLKYKTVDETLRGKDKGLFYNPYIAFKKQSIIELESLLTKEYSNIYGKKLKVQEVVWFVNSSSRMNKVAKLYPEIKTIYDVEGLIKYFLNYKTPKTVEKHAQDFIDLLYLKYFDESLYQGGSKFYKTVVVNEKRKCYQVYNDGYTEEICYEGSSYTQCIDNTLDFIFMRYLKYAKASYDLSDVKYARNLYFSK